MSATPILEVEDLSVHYQVKRGVVHAAEGVSYRLEKGQSLGVVGESGSGKSTVATALLGLLPPNASVTAAKLEVNGQSLLGADEKRFNQVRWKEAAMVFQKSMGCLSPVHRIREQFTDVIAVHQPNLPRDQAVARAAELLASVHLPATVLNAYPHELSGGMTQRVMIALSLVHNPELLILDEATTALDVITQGQILEEVTRLKGEFGLTTMVITHDMSVVAATCDRVAVMYAGHVMEVGPVRETIKAPRHPYTALLTKAFPKLHGERSRILGIPGSLPDLVDPPAGCVFAPRCPRAVQECHHERPTVFRVGDGHYAACRLLAGEGGEPVARAC